jgi:hypothetical protein
MAVLPADVAEVSFPPQDMRSARPGWLLTVIRLLTEDLPDDVRYCEATVVVLFRASQVLNFLTGGCPQMTFSARCHRARRTTRQFAARAAWACVAITIDTACAVLRGEHEHCATAWTNYALRPGRLPRT